MLQSQPLPLAVIEAESEIELSVLVPAHNEEKSIAPLVARIFDALKDFGKPWELIIVDDGSTDATLVNARKEFDREGLDLRIVELQRNFGQAAALQAGIDVARGRLLATLDGDLQNDPYDIPKMIAMLEEKQLDLLCGWRKDRQDGLVLRLIPSWIANVLIRKVTGVRVHDYGCGLKIFRTGILKQVRIIGGMHRFIPALIASVVPTSRIDEMVVSHHARQFGLSKYGISRTLRVVLDLLAVVFFMSFRHRPGPFLRRHRACVRGGQRAALCLSLRGEVFLRRGHRYASDADRRGHALRGGRADDHDRHPCRDTGAARRRDAELFRPQRLRAGHMIDRLAKHPMARFICCWQAISSQRAFASRHARRRWSSTKASSFFSRQWLAVGYDSQPPFYNWLQYGIIQLLGSSVLALAVLKNLMLFLSYLLFGLTAHAIIRDRVLAVIATLALITFPHISYEAQRDLSHTVALLFAACMFFFFFVRALQRPTVVNYAMAGVSIGIGILSKYNFVLLAARGSHRAAA